MKATNKLAELQQAYSHFIERDNSLLYSLLSPCSKIDKDLSLKIYRNNHISSLMKSLSDTYSACIHILGEEIFQGLSLDYISRFRSTSPLLSSYGHRFFDFLGESTMGQQIPFLQDLAHYEWEVKNVILTDFDEPIKQPPPDLEVSLGLVSHVTLFESQHPVSEIWSALVNKREDEIPWRGPFYYLIIKTGFGSKTISISEKLYQFIKRLPLPYSRKKALFNELIQMSVLKSRTILFSR